MTIQEIADRHLRCAACGDGFVDSAGEQELRRLRGIDSQPEHCPQCVRSGAVYTSRRDVRGAGR